MDVVIVSIEERFTLFKDYSELWGFLYDIKKIQMDSLHGYCCLYLLCNMFQAIDLGVVV